MQARIDELLRLIEEEKQNMGAAGKKREEELLNKIAELEAVIAKEEFHQICRASKDCLVRVAGYL